jgi:hypothetical protein
MSLILNFHTEISIIEGNPQAPQIRIDDVEAESCLNVTAIICPNNLRLIIICRLGTCVRSRKYMACGNLVPRSLFRSLHKSLETAKTESAYIVRTHVNLLRG